MNGLGPVPPGTAFELQTVFFDATTQQGLLVTNRDGRREVTPMPFHDAHEALNWCLANRANFVMVPGPDPKAN